MITWKKIGILYEFETLVASSMKAKHLIHSILNICNQDDLVSKLKYPVRQLIVFYINITELSIPCRMVLFKGKKAVLQCKYFRYSL